MDQIYGITLEKLAEYGAHYSAFRAQHDEKGAAAAFEAWLSEHGTGSEDYWLAHKGWTARFRADPTGELQARFQRMDAEYTQRLHANAAQPPTDVSDEPTPDELLDDLASPSRATRWKAARLLAHAIDVGKAKGGQFRAACVPVLIDILQHHDENTAFDAEDAARRLVDIGERTSDVRSSMTRCLKRAEDELAVFEAAATASEQSTEPEQVALRSRIDAYRSLVESLRGYLQDLQESPVASFAPPAAATVRAAAESRRPGKGGGFGIVLPILTLLLLAGGGAAFLLSRRAPPAVSLNAALMPPAPTAAASDAPSAPPPNPEPSAAAAPTEATAAAASVLPAAKHVHAHKGVKSKAKPAH